jgi:hypothetical protein
MTVMSRFLERALKLPPASFALETMLEWTDHVGRQERPGAVARQPLRARALRGLHGRLPPGDLDRLATGARKPYWPEWLASDADFWRRSQAISRSSGCRPSSCTSRRTASTQTSSPGCAR